MNQCHCTETRRADPYDQSSEQYDSQIPYRVFRSFVRTSEVSRIETGCPIFEQMKSSEILNFREMYRKRGGPDDESPGFASSYNLRGPAFLKVILPYKVTGSVIGRGGQVLLDFEQRTGSQIKISPARAFFPTTNERMIMMSGEMHSIRAMIPLLLRKHQEHGMDQGSMMLRIIVPTTSIASIIGKGGEVIKGIQSRTGAYVHICERIEGVPEVIVDVKGNDYQVENGVFEITDIIQSDPRLRDLTGAYYMGGGVPQQAPLQHSRERYPGPAQSMRQQAPHHNEPVPDPTSNPDLLMYPMTIQFVVPSSSVPFIVGENGRSLEVYFRQTGATVSVEQSPAHDSMDVSVSISGPLCGVQAAHILVIKQVTDAIMSAQGLL